jgi:hypothetical protein
MVLGLVFVAAAALAQEAPGDEVDEPRAAWIAVAGVDVLAEPADHAYATMRLPRGSRVTVVRAGPDGWLAIEPPSGAFSWIERSAIEETGNDRARVTARAAAVRPGRDGASLPAGVWTIVPRGTIVRLLDRPPLVIRQPEGVRRVWYAIRSPAAELRYLPEESVEWVDPKNLADDGGEEMAPFPFDPPAREAGGQRRTRLAAGPHQSIDPDLLKVGPEPGDERLSESFQLELERLETLHRRALQGSFESWQLESVRHGYRALEARASSSDEIAAVRLRLNQLDRHQRLAHSAQELAGIIGQSKSRDAEISSLRDHLDQLASGTRSSYSAQGLLQTTSTLVDGRRAYVLIGEDGFATAYISLPPGIDGRKYLGSRIGVRGETRFHPLLKSRVVAVTDLDALDEAP